MVKLFLYAVIIAITAIAGCGPSASEKTAYDKTGTPADAETKYKDLVKSDSLFTAPPVSGFDASGVKTDGSRSFVRTAEMRFKVKNVEKATNQILDISRKLQGFVTSVDVKSSPAYPEQVKQFGDSVLEVICYTVENDMIVRVPNTKLDTFLLQIVPIYVFLENKQVKADDVTLQMLGNELRSKNYGSTHDRIRNASDKKEGDLSDVVYAEGTASSIKERLIEQKISNMDLNDRIAFSTVTLHFYQDAQQYKYTKIDLNQSFKPSFWDRLLDSIQGGWTIIVEVLLVIIRLWSLILLGFGIYIGIRYLIRRRRKKREQVK
jgi:hypothetical protein